MERTITGPCVLALNCAKSIAYVDVKVVLKKPTKSGYELVGKPAILANYDTADDSVVYELSPGVYRIWVRFSVTETPQSGLYEFKFMVNDQETFAASGDVDKTSEIDHLAAESDFLLIVT